jgi:hypothetical protein
MQINNTIIHYNHKGVGSQFMIEISVLEDCDSAGHDYNPAKFLHNLWKRVSNPLDVQAFIEDEYSILKDKKSGTYKIKRLEFRKNEILIWLHGGCYCDFETHSDAKNHQDFVQNKDYNLIKQMKPNDVIIIIEAI